MKKFFILFAIIAFGIFNFQYGSELSDGWVYLNHGSIDFAGPGVKLLEIKDDSIIIEINIDGFGVKTSVENDISYKQIIIPETAGLQDIGKPELPQFGRLLQIPFNSETGFNILNKETIRYDDVLVYPTQQTPSRSNPGFTYPFYINDKFYNTDTLYPSDIISLDGYGILRDISIARIGIYPFQYNPVKKELLVHKSIIVEIVIQKDFNSYLFKDHQISHSFHNIYNQIILNYNQNSKDINIIAGSMLVFVADELAEYLTPLIEWKNQKGIKVFKVLMGDIGSSPSAIKEKIQDAYDAYYPKPAYVLLVGHTETVPPNYVILNNDDIASDYPYTLLEDDQYPDILIGRILAKTPEQVEVQVSKIINYEQGPYIGAGEDFYSKAFAIASNEGDNPTDEEYALYLEEYLLGGNYSQFDLFLQSEGTATALNISNAINEGRSYGTYFGHGMGTAWHSTNDTFDTLTIHGLENGFKLPVIIDVACNNGAFDKFKECFGEAWMWAGTPQDPKGAVAYYGASIGISWHPPAIMAVGIAKHHFEDPVYSIGGSCLAGQMYLVSQLGWSIGAYLNFVWYNLFGDPSMMLRTASPKILDVYHPAMIAVNQSFLIVNVSSDQIPLENVLVCIYADNNPDIFITGFTDPSGDAVLTFNSQITSNDDIRITVSGYNTTVYQGSIEVQHLSDGIIRFDRSSYACDDTALISLIDSDLMDHGFYIVNVFSDTDPNGVEIALFNTDTPGLLQGELHLGNILSVSHNDSIIVSYFDENTGDGSQSYKTDTANIDCDGPDFTDLQISDILTQSAKVNFSTDKKAITMIRYGTEPNNLSIIQNVSQSHRFNHNINLTKLIENKRYYFEIIGFDSLGNETISDLYSFRTLLSLTIGNGDEELINAPLYCGASFNRTQVIYLSSDMGNTPLLINSISMDITSPPGFPVHNWTIRMKHTEKTDHSEAYGFETDNWTIVHNSDVLIDYTGWITFFLEEPFYYNGEDNLMIDFSFVNHAWSNISGQVRWTSTESSQTLYANSNDIGDPLMWEGNTYPATMITNHIINLKLGLILTEPESFGIVELDRDIYNCNSTVTVTVKDSNTSGGALTVQIKSSTDNAGSDLILPEIAEGIFQSAFILGIDLSVMNEDIITVIYFDKDIGCGTSLERTVTAFVDCIPPNVSDIEILSIYGDFAEISFNTDKPSISKVLWGYGSEELVYENTISSKYKTEHLGIISGFKNNTQIYYQIIAEDQSPNITLSNCYSFLSADMIHIGNGFIQIIQAPFYTFYRKNRTSVIYLPEELGVDKGSKDMTPLSSISLNIAKAPKYEMTNFTIRLKHTDRPDFYDNPGMEADGWTIVYQNDELILETGWKTFGFMDFPFIYDGVHNLMVDISYNNNMIAYLHRGKCYWTETNSPRTVYAYSNAGSVGDPLDWEGNTAPVIHTENLILNVIFDIDDSGVPMPPTNLTANTISFNQIDLHWVNNNTNEEGFIVQRKTSLLGQWQNIAQLPADSTYYADHTVYPYNTYIYRVYAFNQYGNSNYSNEASANTFITADAVVYRFFNSVRGGHLYTISEIERDYILNNLPQWNYEGEQFKVNSLQVSGSTPTYRFFNTGTGVHLYTICENERDTIMQSPSWDYEGIKFYVHASSTTGTIPVYRFFNTVNGGHLYTTSEHERDTIMQLPGWNYEGIPFYVFPLE